MEWGISRQKHRYGFIRKRKDWQTQTVTSMNGNDRFCIPLPKIKYPVNEKHFESEYWTNYNKFKQVVLTLQETTNTHGKKGLTSKSLFCLWSWSRQKALTLHTYVLYRVNEFDPIKPNLSVHNHDCCSRNPEPGGFRRFHNFQILVCSAWTSKTHSLQSEHEANNTSSRTPSRRILCRRFFTPEQRRAKEGARSCCFQPVQQCILLVGIRWHSAQYFRWGYGRFGGKWFFEFWTHHYGKVSAQRSS